MMPSYRVEVSPNNRAGCQDAVCKKNGDKIMKGEIRFGVWIEGTSGVGHEFQGWRWRHWGCVSGKTLQNIRENLSGASAGESEYEWDNMDGLEDMPSQYQDKIKRAIAEGKIADEDWKGDPAYNVLGKTGIRGRATPKKKEAEEDEKGPGNIAEPETPVKSVAKKRAREKDEDQDQETRPAKKRAYLAKKEEDYGNDAKPARKPKARKAVKKEEEEEELKPEKKSRARKLTIKREEPEEDRSMKDEADEVSGNIMPAKKSRVKKGPKKGNDAEVTGISTEGSNEVTIEAKPISKARSKKVTKGEETDNRSALRKEKGARDAEDLDSKIKHKSHEIMNNVKKEGHRDMNINAQESSAGASRNAESTYKSEMPEDPLEQIALAFCDRDGPLVSDFNEMIEAREVASDDWDTFLQKKFRNMANAGEIADGDFKGFLKKMHERELAFRDSESIAPKKGRKGKNASTTTARPRIRRGKAS